MKDKENSLEEITIALTLIVKESFDSEAFERYIKRVCINFDDVESAVIDW